MASPLADRIRPHTLDEVVGQEHLLGPGSVLRRVVQGGVIPNMIFYGPSGVGKTTVARIIAASAGKRLHRLNGTTASTADLRAVVDEGAAEYLAASRAYNEEMTETYVQTMVDYGCTFIDIEPKAFREMYEATQSVRDDLDRQYPDFYAEITAAIQRTQG